MNNIVFLASPASCIEEHSSPYLRFSNGSLLRLELGRKEGASAPDRSPIESEESEESQGWWSRRSAEEGDSHRSGRAVVKVFAGALASAPGGTVRMVAGNQFVRQREPFARREDEDERDS